LYSVLVIILNKDNWERWYF